MATTQATEAAAPPPTMNLEARLRRAFHRASGMPPDKELNESFAFFKKIDRDLKRQRPWPLIVDCCGGHVYAWGYGGGGRLGCGDSRGQFRPKLVEALRELPCMLVAAGDSHSMALTTDKGHLYTWGLGDYGKLGHGDTTPALNPRHLEFFRAERLGGRRRLPLGRRRRAHGPRLHVGRRLVRQARPG